MIHMKWRVYYDSNKYGAINGCRTFFISCFLNLFQISKRYIIYPPIVSFVIGLILIPLGFRIELGYFSVGAGILVTSFFGIVITIIIHDFNYKKRSETYNP